MGSENGQHLRNETRLYVVIWSDDGRQWSIVKDEQDRIVPAAYVTASEAEERRAAMAVQFPRNRYRVVGFEHNGRLNEYVDV